MKHETPALGTHTWDKVRLGRGRLILLTEEEKPRAGFWSMAVSEGAHVQGSFWSLS